MRYSGGWDMSYVFECLCFKERTALELAFLKAAENEPNLAISLFLKAIPELYRAKEDAGSIRQLFSYLWGTIEAAHAASVTEVVPILQSDTDVLTKHCALGRKGDGCGYCDLKIVAAVEEQLFLARRKRMARAEEIVGELLSATCSQSSRRLNELIACLS
jgi:hypothetical protein